MNKTCFKCGKEKPMDEFYRHPMMADGHLGKCKECTKRDVTDNRNKDVEQHRAADRWRYRRDGAEKRGAGRWNKNNPELAAAAGRAWRERNKDKASAHTKMGNAVRDGRLKRGPCKWCGAVDGVQGHHHDYSRPLDVMWLCRKHHARVHYLLKEVERAALYERENAF